MKNRSGWTIGIIVIVVFACLCLTGVIVAGGVAYFGIRQAPTILAQVTLEPELGITLEVPNWNDTPDQGPTKTPVPFDTQQPVSDAANETLNTLKKALVPNNDPRLLAERLKGIKDIPETINEPVVNYEVGDEKKFWATNIDTNENFSVDTVLAAETDHAYVWIEKGMRYDESEAEEFARTFEDQIYPTDRKFFGSEWTPGIDGDPHIYILYVRGLGGNLAGYFSSVDSVHPLAHEYSNAHETFFLNADNLSLGEDAYGTMAHEFQHMIHWYRDRNEESWMNEGFSVLAELLNNYDTGGFDWLFVSQPDQQLNDWPNDPNATTPYYGSAFLFVTYFLDRFGDEATQALVENPDNGMDSVDRVLQELDIRDSASGKALNAEDVFADWVVANYINDSKVDDGRYDYRIYPQAPRTNDTEEINNCSSNWNSRTVHQYGADYIRLSCSGNLTLQFEGATEVGVLAESAHSGNYSVWSNKGDESDMTLSQTFDFTGVNGPLEMSFWTWYDLEKDYDYLYLVASEDGQSWEIIKTPSGTDQDPSGNSYGWGYNGESSGWMEETVDLSKFAGKKVQLRFEYVTDAAVNGEGMLIDDISIPAINYSTDFEQDNGGWEPAGWVRIQNRLPQTFRLSLIRNGRTVTVEDLTLDGSQKLSLPLQFGGDLKDAVLVVSGTTRFTRQEAGYRFRFQP